jgi:hypothetical protein
VASPVTASPATIGAPGSISPVPSPRLYVPGFMSTGRAYNDYQKLPSSIGSRHISGAPGSIAPGPIAQKTLSLLLVAGFGSAWVQRRSEDNTAVRTERCPHWWNGSLAEWLTGPQLAVRDLALAQQTVFQRVRHGADEREIQPGSAFD